MAPKKSVPEKKKAPKVDEAKAAPKSEPVPAVPESVDVIPAEPEADVEPAKQESVLDKKRRIRAERKKLLDEERALNEQWKAGKVERDEASKDMATCRATVKEAKSKLRTMKGNTYRTMVDGDVEAIEKLATEIETESATLVKGMRDFAAALTKFKG